MPRDSYNNITVKLFFPQRGCCLFSNILNEIMNQKYLSAASHVLSIEKNKRSGRLTPQLTLDNISHMDLYIDASSTELSYYNIELSYFHLFLSQDTSVITCQQQNCEWRLRDEKVWGLWSKDLCSSIYYLYDFGQLPKFQIPQQ